jgi:hypothetical protein
MLLAMHFDRKVIDIDRRVADSTSTGGALDLDGAIEIGLETVTLSFTHRVVFSAFEGCCFLHVEHGRSRDGFLFFPSW